MACGDRSSFVLSDATDHPRPFLRSRMGKHIDLDGPSAVASRRWLLALAAADRMLVQGDRFPFPAAGYVVRSDDR
jgi:hypothetical protein